MKNIKKSENNEKIADQIANGREISKKEFLESDQSWLLDSETDR